MGMAGGSTVGSEIEASGRARLHFLGRAMYMSSGFFRRFYYAKGMEVDEAYVFVCYDSRADGRARFTPHTGD